MEKLKDEGKNPRLVFKEPSITSPFENNAEIHIEKRVISSRWKRTLRLQKQRKKDLGF